MGVCVGCVLSNQSQLCPGAIPALAPLYHSLPRLSHPTLIACCVARLRCLLRSCAPSAASGATPLILVVSLLPFSLPFPFSFTVSIAL